MKTKKAWLQISSHKSGNKRGVAILINTGNALIYEHVLDKKDKEGSYVLFKGKRKGNIVTLLNICAPPNSELDIYRQMLDILASEAEEILIYGGDFNIKLN